MANMNLFLLLNVFSDSKASNSPNLSNLKWARDIQGVAAESPSNQTIAIGAGATTAVFSGGSKKLIYVECDQDAELTINGGADPVPLKPVVVGTSKYPGVFLLTADVSDLSIKNLGTDEAQVFIAAIE